MLGIFTDIVVGSGYPEWSHKYILSKGARW